MKTIRFITIIGIMIILSGCATNIIWVNQYHNDPQQFQYDSMQCKVYADTMSESNSKPRNIGEAIAVGIMEGMASIVFYNECMKSRGYYQTEERNN